MPLGGPAHEPSKRAPQVEVRVCFWVLQSHDAQSDHVLQEPSTTMPIMSVGVCAEWKCVCTGVCVGDICAVSVQTMYVQGGRCTPPQPDQRHLVNVHILLERILVAEICSHMTK